MHADGDVVVLNIDDVFRNGKVRRPVVGGIAAKLAALDPRAGFYLTGCVVAATLPDVEYQRYIKMLTGSMPQFFVPRGIDPMSRDMEHAMRDPRFAELVRGRTVTSFMGSPALREFVLAHGGNYVMGTDESVGWANDKLNFRSLVEGGAWCLCAARRYRYRRRQYRPSGTRSPLCFSCGLRTPQEWRGRYGQHGVSPKGTDPRRNQTAAGRRPGRVLAWSKRIGGGISAADA